MKKRFLAALATGLLVVGMGGAANALQVNYQDTITDIGSYDTFMDQVEFKDPLWFTTGNSNADELAWINFTLGTSFSLSDYSQISTGKDDWFGVIGDNSGFAYKLDFDPAYFLVKTGNNNNPDGTDFRYFLFENNASLGWAAIQVGLDDGYYIKNIGAVSHLGPVGGDPVPEPATMLLFGAGLAGLAGVARRKKKA